MSKGLHNVCLSVRCWYRGLKSAFIATKIVIWYPCRFCVPSVFLKRLPVHFAWNTMFIFSFPIVTNFLLRIFKIFFWRSLLNFIISVIFLFFLYCHLCQGVFVRRWRWIRGWGAGVFFARGGFKCVIRVSCSFRISFRFWFSSCLSDSALSLVNWSCFVNFSSLSFVVWSCLWDSAKLSLSLAIVLAFFLVSTFKFFICLCESMSLSWVSFSCLRESSSLSFVDWSCFGRVWYSISWSFEYQTWHYRLLWNIVTNHLPLIMNQFASK